MKRKCAIRHLVATPPAETEREREEEEEAMLLMMYIPLPPPLSVWHVFLPCFVCLLNCSHFFSSFFLQSVPSFCRARWSNPISLLLFFVFFQLARASCFFSGNFGFPPKETSCKMCTVAELPRCDKAWDLTEIKMMCVDRLS